MSTLDEITKEKQRLGEALARVDAQREKLTSQLNELEATERVLARYSTGTQARKMSSAKMPTTGVKAAAPARLRGRRRSATAKSAIGSRRSPNLNDQVLALATGKTQQEITAACKGVRPNHVGAAIARHKRAGRVEERDGKLYATQPSGTEQRVAGRLRKEPVVVFASLRCSADRASPSARHKDNRNVVRVAGRLTGDRLLESIFRHRRSSGARSAAARRA
jgi:hypothetical protein